MGVAFKVGVVTRLFATREMLSGPRAHALVCATTLVVTVVVTVFVGCGDPMLPSDYAGPPAATVSGDVSLSLQSAGFFRDADRPRLSLEWLATQGSPVVTSAATLVGQPLRFARSTRIQNDWDIGLETPIDRAVVPVSSGSAAGATSVRVGVGKMIYFDDRDGDGQLSWVCDGRGRPCDQVKAVSREFVVFVDAPVSCAAGLRGEVRQRLSAGYHYYRPEGPLLRKLAAGEPMSFVLEDRTLLESDPSADLRRFAEMLFSVVSRGPLDPC